MERTHMHGHRCFNATQFSFAACFFLSVFFCVVLCSQEAAADEIDFAHEIVPILKTHCAECHTGEHSEGGFSFNTQRQLLESGYVDILDAKASRLIKLVRSVDPDDQMPPQDRKRLTQQEVQTLESWLATGAKWEPGFRFGSTGYEPPLRPRKVTLPPERDRSQNPIDQILAAYFESNDSSPPTIVDDAVFLRRAYMDIIGLPPTLDQQQNFLTIKHNQPRTALVDELLSQDRNYAEHWLSFWNDLLRNDYAGTGYIDGGRRQITQWLYESLLQNKPYDQFVQQLIAPTNESDGFINGIKWRGSVNASQVTEIQFAQNISQVFLGINMKCASCHDSFIDRWTLDEAYGLAAIYSKRELQIHRCDKPVGRTAKARWIFPEIGHVDPAAAQPQRLKQLAKVMTSPQNGRFSRTIVNRLWQRLMGRGIVHPVDAMHTPPWNADLLDYLANYLVEQEYDLKSVLRLIATSQAYQSPSAAAQDSATSAEYVFLGPEGRLLTAEQFMDAVWSIGNTAPRSIAPTLPAMTYYGRNLPDVELSGQWIWAYADVAAAPAGERIAFRKTLTFGAALTRAELAITCDNEYTLFVNGKRVAGDTNWATVEVHNLKRYLKRGANEIVVVARNAGSDPNAAGLYAELVVVDAENKKIRIASDASWLASRKIPKPDKLDSVDWNPAVAVTPQNFLPTSIQQQIKAELSVIINNVRRPARAALQKSDMLMRSLGRPNREQVVTTRPASLSTLQAIDLANGEILDSMLKSAAERLLPTITDVNTFTHTLFRKTICREPSEEELQLAREILGDTPTVEAVQDIAWVLVMLPEFQFVR